MAVEEKTVSFEAELVRARTLREEAAAIEKAAFEARPLPDKWRVGQTVRYLRSIEYGPNRGSLGYVQRLREEDADKDIPAKDYQVFWTGPKDKSSTFWTTPDDVELVEDCK